MMLLRRGAAFTDSSRMVSESWPPPPPPPGRMTPLRRPRDTLGGMKSGAPSPYSPSPHPSRSDMSVVRGLGGWGGEGLSSEQAGSGEKVKQFYGIGESLVPLFGDAI